jgi:hypothetical protein
MSWTIYWDNGADACGTWGHMIFDTEEKAQEYADSVTKDMITEGVWADEGSAEPYWLEDSPEPGQVEAAVEQSLDYFNCYIAGDK